VDKMSFNIKLPVPVSFGEDISLQTGKTLKEHGASKVFCIYDKGVKAAGLADKIVDIIKAEGIEVVEFDGVLPDPPDTIIDEAGEIGRREGVDAVVGLGGGSSLDAAKAINVLLGNPGSIKRYFDMSIKQNPCKPLFLIPTTAGTGSEVTAVAVLTNTGNNNKKEGVVGPNCIATLAIVDPSLTLGLPPHITAATGMDAFSHAAEAFTSKMNNPMSDLLAMEAVSLIAEYLPVAVRDGSNGEARAKLSFAALIAGYAFSNAFPHLGHAIGHTIGTIHHVSHGVACGLAIPAVIEFVADVMPDKIRSLGKAMGLALADDLSPEDTGIAVADAVRKMNKETGVPTLKQLNIMESDLSRIAAESMEGVGIAHTPKKADPEAILKLLQKELMLS